MPLSACCARAEVKRSYRKKWRWGERRCTIRPCISVLELLISIYSNRKHRNFHSPQSSCFFLWQENTPTDRNNCQVLDSRCFCSGCITCSTLNSTHLPKRMASLGTSHRALSAHLTEKLCSVFGQQHWEGGGRKGEKKSQQTTEHQTKQ